MPESAPLPVWPSSYMAMMAPTNFWDEVMAGRLYLPRFFQVILGLSIFTTLWLLNNLPYVVVVIRCTAPSILLALKYIFVELTSSRD